MPDFDVEYIQTQRTRRRVTVKADTPEDAAEMVADYEADLTDSWEVDSIEWSVDEAEPVIGPTLDEALADAPGGP